MRDANEMPSYSAGNPYPLQFKKHAVLAILSGGESIYSVSQLFKINRGTIRSWVKQYQSIIAEAKQESAEIQLKVKTKAYYPVLESLIHDWYKEKVKSRHLSVKDIQTRAMEISMSLPPSLVPVSFTASVPWVRRWKERFNIPLSKKKDVELELLVYKWYREEVTHRHVRVKDIQEKAVGLASSSTCFKASAKWVRGWKKRHNIPIMSR